MQRNRPRLPHGSGPHRPLPTHPNRPPLEARADVRSVHMRPSRRLVALGATVVVTAAMSPVVTGMGAASGAPPSASQQGSSGQPKVNPRLGNGLGRLVAESQGANQRRSSKLPINQGKLAIRDDAGRVMVHLTPGKGVDRKAFGKAA